MGVVLQLWAPESNEQQNEYFECEKEKKQICWLTDFKLLS
jgi:hypothetical protein